MRLQHRSRCARRLRTPLVMCLGFRAGLSIFGGAALLYWLLYPASGQELHQHTHDGEVGHFYQTWMRPGYDARGHHREQFEVKLHSPRRLLLQCLGEIIRALTQLVGLAARRRRGRSRRARSRASGGDDGLGGEIRDQFDVFIGKWPHLLPIAAAQQASRTLPIVFVLVTDPVGSGFVAGLARPGGNATGFTTFEYSMSGKWSAQPS